MESRTEGAPASKSFTNNTDVEKETKTLLGGRVEKYQQCGKQRREQEELHRN